MKRVLSVILGLLLSPTLSWGAMICVGASATGNGSGSDWNNQAAWSSVTFTRGNEYYLADGSYAGKTLSTTASGSTYIEICKATISTVGSNCSTAHGTDTGWSDSYGDGQAVFTSKFTITTSYWVFDGVRGSMSKTASDFGFSFGTGATDAFWLGAYTGPAITNIIISHVYAKATSADTEKMFTQGNFGGGAHSNITVSHCTMDGFQGAVMTRGQSGTPYDNWIFEYDMFLNAFSSPANHGEWINPNERPMTNLVVRHCWFEGNAGAGGQTGAIVANNSNNTGARIYGNVFYALRVGNGIITGTSAGNLSNALIYNNTFISMTSDSGAPIGGPGSGNVAYNNLFYNTRADMNATHDYNAFFSATNVPSEAHGQIASGNPFISSSNFRLKAPTQTGISLPSPYNMDMDGNTRGANGTWNRGAYEYGSSLIEPEAPKQLRIVN